MPLLVSILWKNMEKIVLNLRIKYAKTCITYTIIRIYGVFFHFLKDLKHFQNDILMYNNYLNLYIII
jgi:hypothetical protein